MSNEMNDLIADARRAQNAVYLATEKSVADDLARIIAGLADALEALAEERERTKRGAKTLGEMIKRQCDDIVKITDSQHLIDETGDGDWGLVWERGFDMRDRLAVLSAPQEGDARERLHAKCDCVPDLGPAHCHLCSTEQGEPVPWVECSAVRDAAPEPEWEYGADFSKLSPMAGICTYPNSDDSGRAEAERVVKAARRTDKRVKLVRRRKAGSWKAVES